MKNRYSFTVLLSIFYITSFSQSSYPMETVGTPSSACVADAYTGWTNNGILSYSGNANVQNTNQSNNLGASGGGNVYFDNTSGTYLQISGFNPSNSPASMDITFGMYGYNVNNLSELVLEYSTDGITYTPLPYKRLFRNYLPPTPWDIMVSDPLPATISFTNLKLRFRQTSITQTFRVDDIEANFYSTLPVKLISFSASKMKGDVQVNWSASSTDEKESFVLESSIDGRSFKALSNVAVKGVGDFNYSFTDRPSAEKTFYRLKMIDVNGRSSHSQIIMVQSAGEKAELIQSLYPNPARQVVNTQVKIDRKDNAVVTLTDLSGRTAIIKSFSLNSGINNCSLNVENLSSGVYVLKIVTGNVTESRTIVVQ